MESSFFEHGSDEVNTLNCSESTCVTFTLSGEDYTLGNALQTLISGDLNAEFVGCSIPHPTQQEMNLRIQTHGVPAIKVLDNALDNLIQICDCLTKTYTQSVHNFLNKS
jgi:DNA-directed RNA polymerases I and III subunit RPAC2